MEPGESSDTTQLLMHKSGRGKGQDTGGKRRLLRPEENTTVSSPEDPVPGACTATAVSEAAGQPRTRSQDIL